ncbi:MAG TPA: hypothetical protein VII72_18500 [Myxococcota bacterium]|jgi:hypothetical protein
MSPGCGTARRLLPGIACAALLAACQVVPVQNVPISPQSSLLAVDVVLPVFLRRDLSLVQVYFMKDPIPDAAGELPELIPASFVKWSRGYLLDPAPGTYSVVAVTAEYAPPWNEQPIAGVTDTVFSGISSDAVIFPTELIQRTATAVGAGDVAFMGALAVRRGPNISANALPRDDLQRRIAERIRPGVTSETGISAWLRRARVVDLGETTLSNQPADREAFTKAALADLGYSPWADVVARGAKSGGSPAPAPVRAPAAAAAAAAVPTPVPVPIPEVEATAVTAAATRPEPAPPPPPPRPEPIPGIPPDSPLAKIELGMKHDQVEEILGSPDGRIDRLTARAWIPFYDARGANLREWIYEGRGRVVFSLYQGKLEVVDVVYDPAQGK